MSFKSVINIYNIKLITNKILWVRLKVRFCATIHVLSVGCFQNYELREKLKKSDENIWQWNCLYIGSKILLRNFIMCIIHSIDVNEIKKKNSSFIRQFCFLVKMPTFYQNFTHKYHIRIYIYRYTCI